MKALRLAPVLALVLTASGCRDLIELEKLAKPFACTPGGLDGGDDAGAQCGAHWRCGLAGRCFAPFDTDAGRDWACELDEQCFDGWVCGPRVGETRRCLRLGVGAPSACLPDAADAGCQGGWRCGAESRCFDPGDPDGGLARDCARDAQCPDGLRCGQPVAGTQRCILSGVGAPVPCTSDEGCEGGWRCDTLRQVCALVDDVVTSGRGTSLGAARRSPLLVGEGVPAHLAVTLPTVVPGPALGVSDVPPLVEAHTFAALFDGGAWVSTHLNGTFAEVDGSRHSVLRRWVPMPGRLDDVRQVATDHHALHVLWADGGLKRYDTLRPAGDGALAPAPVRFLRQLTPTGGGDAGFVTSVGGFPLLAYAGWWEDVGVGPDGGALTRFKVGPAGDFAAPAQPFFEPVFDAVPTLGPAYGFAADGLAVAGLTAPGTPGGVVPSWRLEETTARTVRAGLLRGQPAFVLELVRADGGVALAAVESRPQGGASLVGPSSACPDAGEVPEQVAFANVEGLPGALVRCQRASLVQRDRGGGALFDAYPEDQAPFAGPLVSDRTATLGRAHAGAEGRAWVAGPPAIGVAETGSMVDRPLRPELLDRQPDLMVGYFDGRRARTFAQAGGWLFGDEPGLGLLADYGGAQAAFRPLAVVSTERLWLAAESGVVDLATTAQRGGAPRQLAAAPVGERLTAPATGAAFQLRTVDGLRDVVVVASGDRVLAADLTDALPEFGQPATLTTVLVPAPGIRLRGLTLDTTGPDTALVGYVTTGTATWRFSTSDLVSWALSPMTLPPGSALAAELWSEGGRPRLGLADGTVWSLPIAVRLAEPLRGSDGGVLTTAEYGRKCGDLFASTREGVFQLGARADGGLPAWVAAPAVTAALDVREGLRFYEAGAALLVVSRTGRVVELTGAFPQEDGGVCR